MQSDGSITDVVIDNVNEYLLNRS